MARPAHRTAQASADIARFTDRDDLRASFHACLNTVGELPVLMFYGIGGAGKTWLLRKLRQELPSNLPRAFLDFAAGSGQQFVLDPSLALQQIRQQLGTAAPRFDLALGMMLFKQGVGKEPSLYSEGVGLAIELASEIAKSAVKVIPGAELPGAKLLLDRLGKKLWKRIKDLPLGEFLSTELGNEFALALRSRTSQEIGGELLNYLAQDMQQNLPVHFNRAARAVFFFDTYEAVGSGLQNRVQRDLREQWIRDLAANCDFAVVVIAGQNKLTWDEADADWAGCLEQRLVGGLAETDARRFLVVSEIEDPDVQTAILRTAHDPEEGGYHCFSLGLCVDIVAAERRGGREPDAETLRFRPQDWRALADRFLKSLNSDTDRFWIEQLAVTPSFDETAARCAYSRERSAAQDSAWDALRGYSFVEPVAGRPNWFAVRSQMRWALENQPDAHDRIASYHQLWRERWQAQSQTPVDEEAALAWYHDHCLDPPNALKKWKQLAEAARTAIQPRMREHFEVLRWWEPVGLLERPASSSGQALALFFLGVELSQASLGNRDANLRQAIGCYEAALRIFTEKDFPHDWAMTQNNLGIVWSDLPSGDRNANLRQAIACCEAALRVFTESDSPKPWAMTQNNLGNALWKLPSGDRDANLRRAIVCYEAALRIRTESDSPQDWAATQNNLGNAFWDLPSGNRNANVRQAIRCYEAALRVRSESDSPQDWAVTQNNLGNAWQNLPSGDRDANTRRAIGCYEAALRIRTESDFPQDWAATQHNLGFAWSQLPSGDRDANLRRAIACYEAALRVRTENDFRLDWAMTQNNLGIAWSDLPNGDREANLQQAITCYEAALNVCTEGDFPQAWATTQNNLGAAWTELPSGDRDANLRRAIACYGAALRVYTEADFPQDWAMAQNNLGEGWRNLPSGDRDANLRQAIGCYEAALRVYTETDFPHEHQFVLQNLRRAQSSS
jgi:tetratricopeptide (TPR) repeat protein